MGEKGETGPLEAFFSVLSIAAEERNSVSVTPEFTRTQAQGEDYKMSREMIQHYCRSRL